MIETEETPTPGDVKNSFADGIFATIFGTLTGGVFLTGFAIHLGMSEATVGLLAAMPYAATLFQLPASVLIDRTGKRKRIAAANAAAARFIWLLVPGAGLAPFLSPDAKIEVLPVEGQPGLVDVAVLVRDRFPLGVKGNIHTADRYDAEIFHRNLGGIGLNLEYEITYQRDKSPP